MAKPSPKLIAILRGTARKLAASTDYQWGHMGSCNCGYLAQEITRLDKHEIHRYAMEKCGDWNEQLDDYCPTSGFRMDSLITGLVDVGFDIDDLMHLERLSDAAILQALPLEERNLRFNIKLDVIKYLDTWADIVEKKIIEKIELSDLVFDQAAV